MANPPHRLHYAAGGVVDPLMARTVEPAGVVPSRLGWGNAGRHWMFPFGFLPPRNQVSSLRGPIEPSRGRFNDGF